MIARVAGVLLLASTLAGASAFAQAGWTELRSDHFILRGPLSEDRLPAMACEAQQAFRVVGVTPEADTIPSIVAAPNERAIRELLPQFWERMGARPVGGYWSGIYGHHIAVRTDATKEERMRRLLHEVAHFATHTAESQPPTWLDEGLSEIWEHATFQAGQVTVGQPVARHLRVLRSDKNWIPLSELRSATAIPTGGRSRNFYAQSWALAHYLLFQKSGGTLALDRMAGETDLPTDAALRTYVRESLAPPMTVEAGATPECESLPARALTFQESLLARARALADGERPGAALPLLEQLLTEAPTNFEALETLGFVHFRGNRPAEATRAFDRVIAAGKASHVGYFYRALLAPRVPEREYLCAALRLKPGFRPALDLLREKTGELTGCAPNPAVPH